MPKDNEGQKQIEIDPTHIQNRWRVFIIEAFLFCLTLGLGILSAFRLLKIFETQKIEIPGVSFWNFVFSFFIFTFFILFLIHFLKFKKEKGLIFKIIFVLVVSISGLIFLEAWFKEPIPLIVIVFLIFWWWKKPLVLNQDILIIFGIAGTGNILGLSLNPEITIFLLAIFSIYDFIAVYKTKHMVKMAKEMIEHQAILALVVPPSISGFKEGLIKIQPGGNFLVLGGGDIAFPLLFSVSLIQTGILNSLIVALSSLIGLFVGFYIFTSQKIRKPIPALPPIALFSIVGYLITRLI